MANVVHPPLNFIHEPTHLSTSRFGFGFGLPGSSPTGTGKQPVYTPGHTQPSAFQQLTSHISITPAPHRIQKRRLESEDEAESSRHGGRDVPMDRSPTPERPKRAAPKRAKVTSQDDESKDQPCSRTSKNPDGDNDVDVGVLLASLPPQALLPLLNSLINAQPSLKTLILPLIPRPTLDTAIQALEQSARKLRDAYPYSNTPSFSSVSATTSLGFGFGFNSQRTGFGSTMEDDQRSSGANDGSGMRESYILSRLRPHIHEFVSAWMSYVPYFSYVSCTQGDSRHEVDSWSRGHSAVLPSQHKDKSHPTETFVFLSALTTHITCQPALTQASLAPLLLPRLSKEWVAWVDRIDQMVNREGRMFGGETVRSWEKALDEFADARGPEGWGVMREVRDRWVSRVGWLVGRNVVQPMEEEG
ncbi:hypothetical protein L210DRAFT_3610452 [Boletus edulis BED1]|uniref:Tethering factor for nuclear proteasome STS1 n=1 Tax=Boletus edulis BED1 TaxID=1328754 RepID=A0AAD4C2K2_BOLED|nr:hypothetical protein L210DRAFT_3610452 [Boletus edulis BED1]